jgi:Cytochrome c biogenesis factor
MSVEKDTEVQILKNIIYIAIAFLPFVAHAQGTETGQIRQMQQLQEQLPAETKFADLYDQLKANPKDPQLHLQLGHLYLEHRLFELSRSAFNRALQFQPGFAAAHAGLSQLFRQQGLKDREVLELVEAARLEPGNGDYLYRLGVLYMEPATFNYKMAEQQYKALQKMASPLALKLGQLMQK